MTTRTILAAVAALVAAAMTTTALAASTAKDPKTMVLQKSDFPAGASLASKPIRDKTPQVNSYSVEYRYQTGSKTFDLISIASVMNPRLAKNAFREARSLLQQGYRKISLPKYGDEQVAGLAREDNAGELWVRTGGTMWGIALNTGGVLITKADSIAQLKRFAPKQLKRVGSG